ncbi:MAG TPA: hypothetical protein VJR23_05905 [Candidatus Acidoferrales bacterium]|nr:hypothetical protein [Candidatus Acidoferrales bacterium]
MLDSFEEKSSGSFQDYWEMVKRRRWWFMLPFFLAWLVTWGVTKFVPRLYQSEATILVSRQTVPDGFVPSNMQIDFPERLQSLTEQILQRDKLLQVARDIPVYKDQARMTPDQIVNRLRHDMQIQPVPIDDLAETSSPEDPAIATKRALNQPNGRMPEAMAFKISFEASTPQLAQKMDQELAQLFIEANHQERTQISANTTTFLQAQLEDQAQSLDEQEARIQQFKSQYLSELPESREGNMQELSVLQGRLQSTNDSLDKAEQQKLYLETQEAQYKPLEQALSEGKDVSTSALIAAIDKDLGQLQGQLADLKGTYTDQYPDVKRVKEQIAQDESRKKKLEDQERAAAAQAPANSGPTSIQVTSLTELQQMSPILQIQSQMVSNSKEIEDLQKAKENIQGRIDQINALLSRIPLREQQLAELSRGYDQSKTIYQGLLAKAGESEMATDLESRGQSGQFVMLKQPQLPSRPAQPNWFTFSLIGLGVGAALGLALAALSELSDDRIHNINEVKDLVPATTLAKIPPVDAGAKRRFRISAAAEGAIAALMILAMAAGNFVAFIK